MLIFLVFTLLVTLTAAAATPELDRIREYRHATDQLRAKKCLPVVTWAVKAADLPVESRPFFARKARRWLIKSMFAGNHCGPLSVWAFRRIPAGVRAAFMCIHRYEGSWTANTGNGYYGGLQMDRSFMGSYGADAIRRYGLAHVWPPHVQIIVADRARRTGRGYGPWPNTARMCGLI